MNDRLKLLLVAGARPNFMKIAPLVHDTERPVTLHVRSNRLTGLDRLAGDIHKVLSEKKSKGRVPKLWDGKAGERILRELVARSPRLV
jgi:UDP-N-acetylglucosamine 2-epimerase